MSSTGNGDLGLQVKPMGLKVHYTFDKDTQDRCLARHPQLINVQTLALDETSTIGIVDIRLCLQAVAQCSPELLGSFGSDYVVYAYDYSEPDTPLVGQGMLSWLLDPNRPESVNQSLSMVTGRVTKNVLAIFGNGIKETLEVRLKLVHNNKVHRTDRSAQMQQQPQQQQQPYSQQPQMQLETSQLNMGLPNQSMDSGTTSAEWNFFMQSMSGFDAQANIESPVHMDNMGGNNNNRNTNTNNNMNTNTNTNTNINTNIQPAPIANPAAAQPAASQPASRPSSRASRKRQPTGRPRGRPRKRPVTEGHTSGYEDGTDGDDPGPARKRIATTMVSDRAVTAPFTTMSDSLRVAASTSGSLRSFRPLAAAGSDGPTAGSHLQDVPRAPTPVPNHEKQGRGARGSAVRRPSALGRENSAPASAQQFSDARLAPSPNTDDARSPSIAPTPAAFSEDSGAEIGSSPPVPRPSRFMHSSPPPSSPMLPPMPQPDSGFMSGGMGECAPFEEQQLHDGCLTDAHSAAAQAPLHHPHPTHKGKDKDRVPVQYFRLQEGRGGVQDLVQVVSPYSIKPVNESDGPQRPRSARRGSQPMLRPVSMSGNQAAHRASSAMPNLASRYSPSLQSLPPTQQAQGQGRNTGRSTTPVTTQGHGQPAPAAPAPHATAPTPASYAGSPAPLPQPHAAGAEFHPSPHVESSIEHGQPGELSRSHSAGPLAPNGSPRESTPAFGAGDNASGTAPPQAPSRSGSFHDLPPALPLPPIPASDPVGPPERVSLPYATSFSEAPCPPSDAMAPPHTSPPPAKSNKNYVKKQSIKERLERAVMNGEMPPYCSNCGAIETPTWRKVSTQDKKGLPEYYEYSEKPGQVTAIEVLTRGEDGVRPLTYRLIKKALGPLDDKKEWVERLLCNPCGIWLSKNNKHRPEERWIKDQERLGQERRKRGTGRNPTRRKKAASGKDSRDSMPPLTSEANFPTTDGPMYDGMTPEEGVIPMDHLAAILEMANSRELDGHKEQNANQTTASGRSGFSNAESTHTNGTGTANSPIALDPEGGDLGPTRRLLFPSPRPKGGSRDVLGAMSANVVTPAAGGHGRGDKETVVEATVAAREGHEMSATAAAAAAAADDYLEALFRSPGAAAARPSTPPPREQQQRQQHSSGIKSAAFRTPSRPAATPTHRPITRSVARSIRSLQSSPAAAQLAMLQTTPTRTPRGSRLLVPESPTLRRSPRINGGSSSANRAHGGGHGHHRMLLPEGPEMDAALGALGTTIANEMADQADLDAILDKCLGSWHMTPTPRKGAGGWDEARRWEDDLGADHQGDWDLEGLGMGDGGEEEGALGGEV